MLHNPLHWSQLRQQGILLDAPHLFCAKLVLSTYVLNFQTMGTFTIFIGQGGGSATREKEIAVLIRKHLDSSQTQVCWRLGVSKEPHQLEKNQIHK